MDLTEKIKNEIRDHAFSKSSEEVCGLIVEPELVLRCENIANDRDVHFIITSVEINKAYSMGRVIAVYHSHVKDKNDKNGLSDEDEIISEYFNIESIVYELTNDTFYEYKPTGKTVDYVNRPFVRKVLDDVTTIKDYYKRELNIEINNLENRANPERFLIDNGFEETNNPEKHNIILINWGGDKNKPGLLLKIQDNKVIAQQEYERSKITEYNYGMKRWTKKVYRHKSL